MKTLLKLLEDYYNKRNISFAMPGHKNGRGIPEPLKSGFFHFDITELDETDDLHNPGEVLKNTLKKTAKFFGADESFILVNGSTSGIFTMLMACCQHGDTIVVSRCCHKSVLNACIALGLNPIFLNHRIIGKMGLPDAADAKDIEIILQKQKASAVIITSPDYYGFTADIEAIAKVTSKFNIPLLVDEAHGAHFAANTDIFPKTAMLAGADMCVQSAHKTLNAANQTAFLHLKYKNIDISRIRQCFGIFQTTSPSYPLIASADMAREELEKNGYEMWQRVHKNCCMLRNQLKGLVTSPDRSWVGDYSFSDIDECRVVIDISDYEITGYEIADILRCRHKIDVEMADLYRMVLIPTPSNTDEEYKLFVNAAANILKAVDKRKSKTILQIPDIPQAALSPHEAFYKKGYLCRLENAEGHISKHSVTPYPPGIPVVVSGEYITGEIIDYISELLKSGAAVHGVKDGKIEVLQ